jgi:hypothetical protein
MQDAEDEKRFGASAVGDEIAVTGPEADVSVGGEIGAAVSAGRPARDEEKGVFEIIGEMERGGLAFCGEVRGCLFEVADSILG